ncbi:hypothetical protein B5X24_HaOG202139 [Helicoverpa armigera]|uniref:PiggyBac transposable element-derived protein domain-containing protein n=1 Tax=Helicoverpa armigera TaxID=29058 RepID=A0A2W1BXW0_HELAM|nr:hypothetical protein B5X24_HaOG202139 [Helicoverpa armigera]
MNRNSASTSVENDNSSEFISPTGQAPKKKKSDENKKKCVCFRSLSLEFFIYLGKRTTNSTLPSSTSTVLRLVAPLLNLGHVLFMDNWFNSPSLARFLKRRKTDCVGTLRACRKNVPIAVQKAKLVEGEYMGMPMW